MRRSRQTAQLLTQPERCPRVGRAASRLVFARPPDVTATAPFPLWLREPRRLHFRVPGLRPSPVCQQETQLPCQAGSASPCQQLGLSSGASCHGDKNTSPSSPALRLRSWMELHIGLLDSAPILMKPQKTNQRRLFCCPSASSTWPIYQCIRQRHTVNEARFIWCMKLPANRPAHLVPGTAAEGYGLLTYGTRLS